MSVGRDVPGVRYGMYFCAGARVTVADPFGTWTGQIINMSTGPDAEALVAVIDPGGNPHRHIGERLTRVLSELRLVIQ